MQPPLLCSSRSWLLLLHLESLIRMTRQVWTRPLFVEFTWVQTIALHNAGNSLIWKLSFVLESRTIINVVAVKARVWESFQLKKVTGVVGDTNLGTRDVNTRVTESIQQKKVTDVVGGTNLETEEVKNGRIGWLKNIGRSWFSSRYPSQREQGILFGSANFEQEARAKLLNRKGSQAGTWNVNYRRKIPAVKAIGADTSVRSRIFQRTA